MKNMQKSPIGAANWRANTLRIAGLLPSKRIRPRFILEDATLRGGRQTMKCHRWADIF